MALPPTSEPLRALDALESAEVPTFLQTGAHARQLLPEGAGQPGEERLHLGRVDLQSQEKAIKIRGEGLQSKYLFLIFI